MGLASQGAFVITTSQGLILIDTLNTTEEARDILVPSMKKVGLDPAQIKYIVLSHGHPGQTDHTGGANYLQRTYHPRVMMSKEDWDATLPAQKPERPLATRDMDIVHGQTLTLGDETLTFTVLYGHTPGTLGIFIPVKWHGQPHVVVLHGGGLQHPNRDSLNRFESVINDVRAQDERGGHPERPPGDLPGHARGHGDDSEESGRAEPAALWTGAGRPLLEDHGRVRDRARHRPRTGSRSNQLMLNVSSIFFAQTVRCLISPDLGL